MERYSVRIGKCAAGWYAECVDAAGIVRFASRAVGMSVHAMAIADNWIRAQRVA